MSVSSNHHQQHSDVWFGVSMVLIGVIAGFLLASVFGTSFTFSALQPAIAENPSQVAPTAPAAPVAPSNPTPPVQQGGLSDALYPQLAQKFNLDVTAFNQCLTSGKNAAYIQAEEAAGTKAGVNGTPGNIIVDLKRKRAVLIPGARAADSFTTVIDAMIAGKDVTKDTAMQVTPVTWANVTAIDPTVDHIRGNAKASIAIIEYSDFECPFCQRVHPTFKQIISSSYGDKIMWVYRFFPLSFHPHAQKAAEAAQCAYEQGGNDMFWNYADALFTAAQS